MLRPTNIQYLSISGAIGTTTGIAALDVNQDGYLDVIVANSHAPFQDAALPLRLLVNDQNGGFKAQSSVLSAQAVMQREFIVADFNGDGIADIFFADHGYDLPPFPGASNGLLLGKAKGGFQNATGRLPKKSDFTHSAVAVDIDGDGDLDIYVGNIREGDSGPYFLINSGKAKFTLSAARLPSEVAQRKEAYSTSGFADVNGDGHPDLFLGGDATRPILLLNNGAGQFSKAPAAVPAGAFAHNNSVGTEVVAFDFNRDGRDEILYFSTQYRPFYEGSSLQVLSYSQKNAFEDVTSLYFDSAPQSPGWVKELFFIDLNGDGAEDMIAQTGSDQLLAYLNDGENRFYQLDGHALMQWAGLATTVADLDNDGRKEIIQVGSYGDPYNVQIVRLLNSAGNVKGTAAGDTIFGDASAQRIDGFAGDDVLAGGGGNDRLLGGRGSDKLLGGAGDDRLSGGRGADSLAGGLGNDLLEGHRGNDQLYGGSGNDSLNGGIGADVLHGGRGADHFIFTAVKDSTASRPDRILDFRRKEGDKIDLQAIDAMSKQKGDQDFSFIGAEAFSRKAGELRYENQGGKTTILADVTGNGVADLVIILDASIALRESDFLL